MRAASLAVVVGLGTAAMACAARPKMCIAPAECGSEAMCVAGRCQKNKGLPQIQSARRVLFEPVAMAYVRPGDGARDGAPPTTCTLGRESDGDARLYLRFEVPLPREANVVEAYLLLQRADEDADPGAVVLHASRVVSPWDPRAISWGIQPALEDVRAPSTFVTASGRRHVRLDVRDLVSRWRAHDRRDHGIAIVADARTATGVSFALAPATPVDSTPPARDARTQSAVMDPGGAPPELELYVK